jgi:hypothetical protein
MASWQLQEAKARFSEFLNDALIISRSRMER